MPVLFSVIPLPSGKQFTVFFILDNGTDTSDCGGSKESACASLLHVLMLYFGKPPEMGLEIRTDQSLVIEHNVVVGDSISATIQCKR